MKAHYIVTGFLFLAILTAGCIHGVTDSHVPTEDRPPYAIATPTPTDDEKWMTITDAFSEAISPYPKDTPTDTVIESPFPPDNAPDLRHTSCFRFDGWENPANYTRFCPPSYVPEGYTPYDLLIFGVWNETELNYTVVCETLRYAFNSTSWCNTDLTLFEVSWSGYGYNPYARKQNLILREEPKSVVINGYTGWIYELEPDRLITWTAGNTTYQVYGSLDREELLRVARSIVC